jgi:uncharacterized C2H2 Zn-finger protein
MAKHATRASNGFRLLARRDIPGFDAPAVALILEMGAAGWEGRVSNKNHAIMRAPDGTLTLSVSQNTYRKLSMANNRHKFEQWLDEQPKEKAVSDVPKVTTQKWPCPRCNKTFASEQFLSDHIHLDHEKMIKCPECGDWYANNQKLSLHRANKHGYVSPTKAKRDARKANKALVDKARAERGEGVNANGTTVADMIGADPELSDALQAIAELAKPAAPAPLKPGEVKPNYILTSPDGEDRMRIVLEGDTIFVVNAGRLWHDRPTLESRGWKFEKIRPPAIEVFRALKIGTIVAVCYEFKDKKEMWAIIARGDGDTYVDMQSMSQKEKPIAGDSNWEWVVMIHELGTELY